MTVEVDGVDCFQTVQAPWNLLETSAAPAVVDAHARGWGVIVKEALGNGRLADRADAAFSAALAQPWANVVLSGAVTPMQLRQNMSALVSPQPPDAYWRDRKALAWD